MPSTAESRRRRGPLNSCSRTQAERQVYSRWTGYRRKLTLAVHRLKHPYPCASRTSPSAGQPRPPLCSGIAHGTNPPRALSQNGYGRSVRLERANLKGLVLGCIEATILQINMRWKRAPLRYPKTDIGKKRIPTISTASPRNNIHIGPAYGNSFGGRPSFT